MSAALVAASPALRVHAVRAQRRSPVGPQVLLWSVTLALAASLGAIEFASVKKPAGMSVREQNGQLMIAWKPSTTGRLEILDGNRRTAIEIPPQLCGLTYARRSGDVSVLLITESDQDTAHFVARDPRNPGEMSAQMRALSADARSARIETESELWRISRMQSSANRMIDKVTPPLVKPAPKPAAEKQAVIKFRR